MALSISVRKLEGVFFPGDSFRCVVEFKNTRPVDAGPNGLDNLAWASAQIHGQYIVDPNLIKLPLSTVQKPLAGSILPKLEFGRIMYSSNAELLVCDMKLKPQETKTVIYTCLIPTESLPPSFGGTSIKYSNVLTIVAQKSASPLAGPPKIMTIPFRILNPSCGLRKNEFKLGCPGFKFSTICKDYDQFDLASLEFRSSRISKPIKDKETRKILKAVFEKFGKPVCIKINRGVTKIADFTLEKTAFQLGDAIRGFIDFSSSSISCYQLKIRLESVEEVASEYFANHPGRPSSTFHKVVSESEELLHNTHTTHFEFYLPLEASPTFATELISVRWLLKFELIASTIPTYRPGELNVEPFPQEGQVEKMNWQVPIKVLVASYPADLLEEQQRPPRIINC